MIPPIVVTASGNVQLNNASEVFVGRWLVDLVLTGGTYSVKPQKRLHISDASGAGLVTAHAFQDCWYTLALTNAQVPASTTQTASGILLDIDASGCDVQLVVTVAGGGSLEIFGIPLLG